MCCLTKKRGRHTCARINGMSVLLLYCVHDFPIFYGTRCKQWYSRFKLPRLFPVQTRCAVKKRFCRRNPFNRKNQGNSGIFGKYEFSCNFPEQIIKNITIKIGKLTVIMELKVKNIIWQKGVNLKRGQRVLHD